MLNDLLGPATQPYIYPNQVDPQNPFRPNFGPYVDTAQSA